MVFSRDFPETTKYQDRHGPGASVLGQARNQCPGAGSGGIGLQHPARH